jgi:hypothetical protein
MVTARELDNAVVAGHEPLERSVTVARFLDAWLDTLGGTVAPSTEQQYRDVVRLYVRPHIGRVRIGALQPRQVTAMIRELEHARLAANTRRLARSVLRRALRWGQNEGTVARNVAAIADGVRLEADEGRTLTPAQARMLLATAEGDRLEAAVTVALALGLRLGELLAIAWCDVDLEGTPPVSRSAGRSSAYRAVGSSPTNLRPAGVAAPCTCRRRWRRPCAPTAGARSPNVSSPATCGNPYRSDSTSCFAPRQARPSTRATSAERSAA